MSKEQELLKEMYSLDRYLTYYEKINKALEDLELYKKAFEIATKNNKYEMLVIKRQARKELSNERH